MPPLGWFLNLGLTLILPLYFDLTSVSEIGGGACCGFNLALKKPQYRDGLHIAYKENTML